MSALAAAEEPPSLPRGCAALLAVDPAGLGGARLRAGRPGARRLAGRCARAARRTPWRRLPLHAIATTGCSAASTSGHAGRPAGRCCSAACWPRPTAAW
jgi:hypothetical protein